MASGFNYFEIASNQSIPLDADGNTDAIDVTDEMINSVSGIMILGVTGLSGGTPDWTLQGRVDTTVDEWADYDSDFTNIAISGNKVIQSANGLKIRQLRIKITANGATASSTAKFLFWHR